MSDKTVAPKVESTSPPPDFIEAGEGPCVLLVHSSVAGARQWRQLLDDGKDRFHLRAVNLFGYGRTPPWPNHRPQTIDDQVGLIAAAIPVGSESISLVGYSFGGWVAMRAAAKLGARVTKLVLFEPNPFHFLHQAGRTDAFAEAMQVREWIKHYGADGNWSAAAERFADHWGGAGTWSTMADERKRTFANALKPNFHEWDVFDQEEITIDQLKPLLPEKTLIIASLHSPRSVGEIVELFRESCPQWQYEQVPHGGHMAPFTRPDLVNPIITSFLASA